MTAYIRDMTLYYGGRCVRVPEETQVSVYSELELQHDKHVGVAS